MPKFLAVVAVVAAFGFGVGITKLIDGSSSDEAIQAKAQLAMVEDELAATKDQLAKTVAAAADDRRQDADSQADEVRRLKTQVADLEDKLAAAKGLYEDCNKALARQVAKQTVLEERQEERNSNRSASDEFLQIATWKSDVAWLVPSLKVKIVKQNDHHEKHSWQLDIRNNSSRPFEGTVLLEWLDSDGFVVDYRHVVVSHEFTGEYSENFRGTHLLTAEIAAKVYEVRCRIEE